MTALRDAAPPRAVRTFAGSPTTKVATLRARRCAVRLLVDDPLVLRAATTDLARLLARVDAMTSRFRPDSALSRANRLAGRSVPVPRQRYPTDEVWSSMTL